MFIKIIFNLDGTGLVYNPHEPIHLDSLLQWCLMPFHRIKKELGKNDLPDEIPLPLLKHTFNDKKWVWQASALFPEGKSNDSIQYWRKRFRQNRIEFTQGNPNLKMGIYRDWNNPLIKMHCLKMIAYANGNRKKIKKALRQIKFLGKKHAYGSGRIVSIDYEEINENYSLVKNGCAMRWLPDEKGIKMIRLTPPYWNNVNKIKCCEIGDSYKI